METDNEIITATGNHCVHPVTKPGSHLPQRRHQMHFNDCCLGEPGLVGLLPVFFLRLFCKRISGDKWHWILQVSLGGCDDFS